MTARSVGDITRLDPAIQARLNRLGVAARRLGLVYAVVVFIGRLYGWGPVVRGFGGTGVRPTSHSAATAFLFLAVAAVLVCRRQAEGNGLARRLGLAAAGASALLAAAIVLAHLTGFDLVTWGPVPTEVLERPSLQAAAYLFLVSLAIPLTVDRREPRALAGQLLALSVAAFSLIVLLGYLLGDPSVGAFPIGRPLSIPSAVSALLISLGVILARPGTGLLSLAVSPGPGGKRLRALGLFALLVPVVLIGLAETVPEQNRIGVLASVSVLLGLLFLTALYWVFGTLDAMAVEASAAAADAARAEDGLDQEAPLVARLRDALHIAPSQSEPPWEVATRYRPAEGVLAGDASAVVLVGEAKVAVVLVDVVGHGVLPALRAVRLRDSMIQSLATGSSPAQALEVARWLTPGDILASAVVAVIDAEDAKLRLASAGHPPSVLTTVQTFELLESTGPILFDTAVAPAWEEHVVEFGEGDTLVVFSDGVADVQRERDGRPEPQRLAELLHSEGGEAERSAHLALGFAPSPPADDQTVLAVRRISPRGEMGVRPSDGTASPGI